ncbi:MAG: alanine racemase [Verrucomicrobiae bacterium]|nr:alanine racemase [Verrucomicrobiae bacterium]
MSQDIVAACREASGKEFPKPGLRRVSAWVEVDLAGLGRNVALIRADLPAAVGLMYVAKDDAYGLGAVPAVRTVLGAGGDSVAVVTLDEAAELRAAGIRAPILLMGERLEEEWPDVLELDLEPAIGSVAAAEALNRLATRMGRRVAVHLKINTGMNRFGFPWREVEQWSVRLARLDRLEVAGVFGHFAQSDEPDKTYARTQSGRFEGCLDRLREAGISPCRRHHANSGGALELPESHFDLVRVGILAHGVYPSASCRRVAGLEPVMTVKARVVAEQPVDPGDSVGYGMRWTATRRSRIGVMPVGYGDGYPRLRNEGRVLIRGRYVPVVGGVTMDALMVDLTEVPEAGVGDEGVLMGRQGGMEITPYELARLKRSVPYEILLGWRHRLPRVYLEGGGA